MIARLLIALGALIVIGAVDLGVVRKETLRRHGDVVFLELVPVDPRSLMQGDYMALRFQVAREIERAWEPERPAAGADDDRTSLRPPDGTIAFAPLALDGQGVATLAPDAAAAQLRLRYRVRNGAVWPGTNAFFFSEGDADRFRGARYGEFRLDKASGEAMLVGLRDAKLTPL